MPHGLLRFILSSGPRTLSPEELPGQTRCWPGVQGGKQMSTDSILITPRSWAREIRLALVVIAVCLLAVLAFATGRVTADHHGSAGSSPASVPASAIDAGSGQAFCHPHHPC
jgi:hypothetical protein